MAKTSGCAWARFLTTARERAARSEVPVNAALSESIFHEINL